MGRDCLGICAVEFHLYAEMPEDRGLKFSLKSIFLIVLWSDSANANKSGISELMRQNRDCI